MHITVDTFDQHALGSQVYISCTAQMDFEQKALEIFFKNRLEEKKIFNGARLEVVGDLFEPSSAKDPYQLLNAEIKKVTFHTEVNLKDLSFTERLIEVGLSDEFEQTRRKDRRRALAILEAIQIDKKYHNRLLGLDFGDYGA